MSVLIVPDSIVTTEWLFQRKDNPNLCILDATIPKVGQTLDDISSRAYIEGALDMKLKTDFTDPASALPNTIPSSARFTEHARKLGIGKNSCVICYDAHGVYSSPRAWFLLRAMGHANVAVLNGGLPKWQALGFPVSEVPALPSFLGDMKGEIKSGSIFSMEAVQHNLSTQKFKVVDARSQGRFTGTVPEPRAGLRGGHIPGSISLPVREVIDGFELKSREELQTIFSKKDLLNQSVVTSCGSGITASVLALSLIYAGNEEVSLYDGSWTEWASEPSNPVELG